MRKHINKLFAFLILLFLISSCNQTENQKPTVEDPKLVLKSLTIFKDDVDIDIMKYVSNEEEIRATNIVAKFDYGEETDEAIGVVIEGGTFLVDMTKPKEMKLSVPAVKGEHKGWSGSVMVSIGIIDMEIAIGYDGRLQEDGKEEILSTETVEFIVQSKKDIVEKAIINDGVKDHELNLKEVQAAQGSTLYGARLLLLLRTDDFVTYKIKVIPKDKTRYNETNVSYKLKGTKIADNNAEFVYINDGNEDSPLVVCDIKWEQDYESRFYEDYGALSIKMTAQTVSPRASVFLKIVNPLDDSPIATSPEVQLTNNLGMHTGDITLFNDKPTKLIAYVKAGDGNTTNETRGKWQVVFNSVDLFWGYDDSKLSTEELRKTATKAYSEIEVVKTQATLGKVYMAFSIWDESVGFKPSDAVQAMAEFAKLDTVGNDEDGKHTAYKFSVDISSLNVGEEKNIEIPIMRIASPDGTALDEPFKAFTYKIKLKIR